MDTKKWILLGSTPLSAAAMKSLIARYWCRNDEENCIEISFKENEKPPYSVYQDGILMEGFRVRPWAGRYRFEGEQ